MGKSMNEHCVCLGQFFSNPDSSQILPEFNGESSKALNSRMHILITT